MHILGASLLLVDCDSNALIVAGNEIRYKKEKIHGDRVSAVAVGPGEVFATGSRDKLAKIWDKTL
jgi:WD40 repeat protein